MKRFACLLWLMSWSAWAQNPCDASQMWNVQLNELNAEACALKKTDARGFTAYDIAALRGQSDIQQWLVTQNYAKEGQYSSALLKLLQTGLRYLGHDAGIINGEMNAQTVAAIKAHQKSLSLSPNGKIQAHWLSAFYRQLTKKMQQQFNLSGVDVGAADGIIGTQTRQAMQQFRQKHHLPVAQYASIDDQLIYRLMMEETDTMRKSIQRQSASKAETKKDVKKETPKKEVAQSSKNNSKAKALPPQKAAANKVAAKPSAAQSKARTQKNEAAKTAQAKKQSASSAAKNKTSSKTASTTKNTNKKTPPRNAEKPTVTAKKAVQAPKKLSPEQVLAQQKAAQLAEDRKNSKAVTIKKKGGFSKVSGRLSGSGSSCNVGGHRLDGSWCSAYAHSKGSLCSALLDGNGKVFSLTCGKKK